MNPDEMMELYKKIDPTDCSTFPPGPWDGEPNSLEWVDEATGYTCRIKRGCMGYLLGYVDFPDDPSLNIDSLEVHGGITFDELNNGIRTLGFDMGHFNDMSPMNELMVNIGLIPKLTFDPDLIKHFNIEYRNIGYVKKECTKLAESINISMLGEEK